MKRILIEAGLGEKKLVIVKNKDAEYLRDALLEHYPKLKDGGGYELMRSSYQFQVVGTLHTISQMGVDLALQFATLGHYRHSCLWM